MRFYHPTVRLGSSSYVQKLWPLSGAILYINSALLLYGRAATQLPTLALGPGYAFGPVSQVPCPSARPYSGSNSYFLLPLRRCTTLTSMKHSQNFWQLFLRGMGIGSADIVPGISGGTVALLTGVYEALLQALQAFDATALRLLGTGQFSVLWKHLHGAFLLPLVLGIGLSLATTVRLVIYLLTYYPIQTWSFFLGLSLVAAFTVYQKIKRWQLCTLLMSLGGLVVACSITRATPLHTPDTGWFIGLAGCIAVCAMLLPGISGSFVLVLLGKYVFMLHALQALQLRSLIPFVLGGGVGLLSFSRVIAWLLRRHHDNTLALLTGFMLGSLNRVWPWQQPLSVLAPSSFAVPKNLSPLQFQAIYHQDPLVPQALFWMSLGVLLVLALERRARRTKRPLA